MHRRYFLSRNNNVSKSFKLRNCPFCLGVAALCTTDRGSYYVTCTNVQCLVLPRTVSFRRHTEAVEAWNSNS